MGSCISQSDSNYQQLFYETVEEMKPSVKNFVNRTVEKLVQTFHRALSEINENQIHAQYQLSTIIDETETDWFIGIYLAKYFKDYCEISMNNGCVDVFIIEPTRVENFNIIRKQRIYDELLSCDVKLIEQKPKLKSIKNIIIPEWDPAKSAILVAQWFDMFMNYKIANWLQIMNSSSYGNYSVKDVEAEAKQAYQKKKPFVVIFNAMQHEFEFRTLFLNKLIKSWCRSFQIQYTNRKPGYFDWRNRTMTVEIKFLEYLVPQLEREFRN